MTLAAIESSRSIFFVCLVFSRVTWRASLSFPGRTFIKKSLPRIKNEKTSLSRAA